MNNKETIAAAENSSELTELKEKIKVRIYGLIILYVTYGSGRKIENVNFHHRKSAN
mgnify:CR=1 FL=1